MMSKAKISTFLFTLFTLLGLYLWQYHRETNAIHWQPLSQPWLSYLKATKGNQNKDFLKKITSNNPKINCGEIFQSNIQFKFQNINTIINQNYILLIRSSRNHPVPYKILYKGKTRPLLTIKNFTYCSHSLSDDLAFFIFDHDKKRFTSWGSKRSFKFYDGKINIIQFLSRHSNKYLSQYYVKNKL